MNSQFGLGVSMPQPICELTIDTEMVGFPICIETYLQLIPKLLTVQPYVLGYKLNQDHLEHFFNAVRKAGESHS